MSRRRAAGRTPNASTTVHAPIAAPQHAAPPPLPATSDNPELFVDLMMGAPLQIFVEKDVPDRDEVVRLIEKHGGIVATAYSTVPYILVDPAKESGQNLFRQYSAKRGKIVLNAAWVDACVREGQLQTFKTNYAGFKVDGTERDRAPEPPQPPPQQQQQVPPPETPRSSTRPRTSSRRRNEQPAPTPTFAHPPTPTQPITYPPHQPPSQAWAEHAHYAPPPPSQQTYYAGAPPPSQWATSTQTTPYSALTVPVMEGAGYVPPYTAYPGDDQGWGAGGEEADQYYDQAFQQVAYEYVMPAPGPSVQPPQTEGTQSPEPIDPDEVDEEHQRGRKRTRSGRIRNALSEKVDPQKLVSARGPPTRSPDPPARVIKSTHGGNLFTSDDVEYLKAYIEYCQHQGLVLSLREICERLAVKAPHHTFYSWRRYCNKHQIRLGAYTMDDPISDAGPSSSTQQQHTQHPATTTHQLAAPSSSAAGVARPAAVELGRTDRSPTPPRALYRSTTGKGIAFTETDVRFLMRFLTYRRRRNPELDMVQFWKDVAERAPHHSRASWMKYWRRHKHELEADPNANGSPSSSNNGNPTQQDTQPLPEGPPQKRKRYDHEDDMLLARYFASAPQGTSDAIFQRFARMHPHHPWKGWQEHHRIHKTQIDHLMKTVLQDGQASASGGASGSAMGMGIGHVSGMGVGVVGVDDGMQSFGIDGMDP